MAAQADGTVPYVFLSYTSPDRERVLALADTLEAAGIRVWVDRRDSVGGSNGDTSIVHAISHCTVFALTCSPASLAAPNVQQQREYAVRSDRSARCLLAERLPEVEQALRLRTDGQGRAIAGRKGA